MKQPPVYLKTIIDNAERDFNLPPGLLTALLYQESKFNLFAVSKAGAQGIAQFMPSTSQQLGVDPWSPWSAIPGAARYLRSMIDKFQGSIELGLAAYNAGPGNVQKYGGIPPFKETQNYVQSVLGAANIKPTPTPTPREGEGIKLTLPKESYYKPTIREKIEQAQEQVRGGEDGKTKMMDAFYKAIQTMVRGYQTVRYPERKEELVSPLPDKTSATPRSPVSLGLLGRSGYSKVKPGYGIFPMPPIKEIIDKSRNLA